MRNNRQPFILIVSFVLTGLIIIISLTGILISDFYSAETANWQAQSIGQDIVDLFVIVPCLIITSVFAYRNNNKTRLLWGGVLCYLIYTFIIYCFGVHFNRLFVVYCFTLGLSFYSFLYFFLHRNQEQVQLKSKLLTKIIAIYFLIISVGFYVLWLSEIIPSAVQNTIPQALIVVGLATNPVHVIDLSVILPGLFITSILLFNKNTLGFILVPVFLVFSILMNITIGALQVIMVQKGIESGLSVLILMSILAIFSAVLLFYYFKNAQAGNYE